MSDYRGFSRSATQGAVIDQGLRGYMQRVYGLMAAGLAVTGLTAFGVLEAGLAPVLFTGGMKYIVLFAPLAVVMYLSFRVYKMSAAAAQMWFWIYSALVGVSFAPLFFVFTSGSLARVFFVTAATFAVTSLYGYTTKRDLSSWGSFLFMGVIGIIIAGIVNVFLMSSALNFALSVLGVLIFTGFTAYDSQTIREGYFQVSHDGEATGKAAIMGALNLYLDFINIFTSLLNLTGDRR